MVVADINENGGKQTVDAMPESMKFHKADVTKENDWKLLVEATQDVLGGIDCLVNNAGTTYRNKASISRPHFKAYLGCTEESVADELVQPTLDVTESEFDKCFNVNVKSVFFGTSAVLPHMVQRDRGGSIINIASVGATRPRPGLVWYNSSKGAIWNVSITTVIGSQFAQELISVHRRQRVLLPNLGRTRSALIRFVRCSVVLDCK